MNETERDILYEIRNIYVGGDGIILPRERLGVVVGYMVELEMRIRGLTAERDRVRDILRRLLDAFGTPATRETETNLSEAMTAYEAADMKDEAHVLRTTIEAIGAALGIESEAGE